MSWKLEHFYRFFVENKSVSKLEANGCFRYLKFKFQNLTFKSKTWIFLPMTDVNL